MRELGSSQAFPFTFGSLLHQVNLLSFSALWNVSTPFRVTVPAYTLPVSVLLSCIRDDLHRLQSCSSPRLLSTSVFSVHGISFSYSVGAVTRCSKTLSPTHLLYLQGMILAWWQVIATYTLYSTRVCHIICYQVIIINTYPGWYSVVGSII